MSYNYLINMLRLSAPTDFKRVFFFATDLFQFKLENLCISAVKIVRRG